MDGIDNFPTLDPTILNVFGAIMILLGVAYTFFGARIHSVIHGFVCFFLSFPLVLAITLYAFNGSIVMENFTTPLIISLIVSILIGVGCYFLKRLQACILGLEIGLLLAVVVYALVFSPWNTNMYVMAGWVTVSMCTFAVLGCVYPNKMLVYLTSLIGSLYTAFAISIFTGHMFIGAFHWTMILFILVGVGLFFLGAFVQHKLGFHRFEFESAQKDLNAIYIPIPPPGPGQPYTTQGAYQAPYSNGQISTNLN